MLKKRLNLSLWTGLLSTFVLVTGCQLDAPSASGDKDAGSNADDKKPAIAAVVASNLETPPGFTRLGSNTNWQVYRNCLAYKWPNSESGALYALDNGVIYSVSQDNGYREPLGTGRYWSNVGSNGSSYGPAMTALKDTLYVVANNWLYRVDTRTGKYKEIGGKWWDRAAYITSNEVLNKLYIMHRWAVYEVNPQTGAFTRLTGEWWDRTTGFASHSTSGNYPDHQLMVIHNGRWYSFRPKVLSSAPADGYGLDFGRGMMATDFKSIFREVYTVRFGDLVYNSPHGNQGTMVSAGYWNNIQSMICGGGNIYLVSSGALFKRAIPVR